MASDGHFDIKSFHRSDKRIYAQRESSTTSTTRSSFSQKKWSPLDFHFGKVLGEGLFGKVYVARMKKQSMSQSILTHTDSSIFFDVAIKIMDKQHVLKIKQQRAVLNERNILTKFTAISSPWTIALHMSFVDEHNLYIVMELCTAGDLNLFVKQNQNKMNKATVQYYTAQILNALEHLHSHSVYHGDLKPENILLTSNKKVKLADFGCAVDLNNMTDEAFEFTGTADYTAPEVIKGFIKETAIIQQRIIFAAIDLWSFGCIIYFMFLCESPFHTKSDYLTLEKILAYAGTSVEKCNADDDLKYSIDWPVKQQVPCDAKDLILKLLVTNPKKRIGALDVGDKYCSLWVHEFFCALNSNFVREQKFDYKGDAHETMSKRCHNSTSTNETFNEAETVILSPQEKTFKESEMIDGAEFSKCIEFFS